MDISTRHSTPAASGLQYVARNKCYEIAYHEGKNRIYFDVLGFWKSPESVPDLLSDWDHAVQLVSPGFTLLVDMRTMITHPQQLYRSHEQYMQRVKSKDVGRIANVMPTDKIASLQVSEIASRCDLDMQTFESREAADMWLDKPMA